MAGARSYRCERRLIYCGASQPPTLGRYMGANPNWFFHDVVVSGESVFDKFTGGGGMPMDEYLQMWQGWGPYSPGAGVEGQVWTKISAGM